MVSKTAEAWRKFLFNEESVVTFLKMTPPEEVAPVLSAGASWTGTGWTNTQAAKAVRALTGLTMVAKFQDYRNAFLCSLALCAGLEIPALELSYRAEEIVFALSEH